MKVEFFIDCGGELNLVERSVFYTTVLHPSGVRPEYWFNEDREIDVLKAYEKGHGLEFFGTETKCENL